MPWSYQTQAFFQDLRAQGFTQAPIPLGCDEEYGYEILSIVPGETGSFLENPNLYSVKALTSSALLLKAYHNAAKSFVQKYNKVMPWMLPILNPQEVICHSDFAPYNICFEGDSAIGVIDFETAHPGPALYDIVYALYRFAPFHHPSHPESIDSLDSQIPRAKLFLDVYGLPQSCRKDCMAVMIQRLEELYHFLVTSAANGDPKYQQHIESGHNLLYQSDFKYLKSHRLQIQSAL